MNYIIDYEIHLKDGGVIRNKTIRVKNQPFAASAEISLEKYLKRHHPNFQALRVISCREDRIMDIFNNIFNGFNK